MVALLLMILAFLFGFSVTPPPVIVDPVDPSPTIPVVEPAGSEITLRVGESKRVVIGTGNPSIGDGYGLADEGDPSVVKTVTDAQNDTPGCNPGGCRYTHYLVVTGVTAGTTQVTTQYCFRSSIENCDAQGKAPVVWTVTVTD